MYKNTFLRDSAARIKCGAAGYEKSKIPYWLLSEENHAGGTSCDRESFALRDPILSSSRKQHLNTQAPELKQKNIYIHLRYPF
ncbi:hypothetical protein FKM82_021203 [Ascaphus truei]